MVTTLSVHWLIQINGYLADHRGMLNCIQRNIYVSGGSLAHRFNYWLAVHICWLLVPASIPYPGLNFPSRTLMSIPACGAQLSDHFKQLGRFPKGDIA